MENPEELVKVGDPIEVKVLRVDSAERKIGLSLKRAQWGDTDRGTSTADDSGEARPEKSRKSPKRGGMDDHGAMGTDKITFG